MKGHILFQGEMITKWRKYIDEIKKSSFPVLLSLTLDTKLLVCSDEGPNPKGENTLNTVNEAKYVKFLRNLV